jgi:hypothetical protein
VATHGLCLKRDTKDKEILKGVKTNKKEKIKLYMCIEKGNLRTRGNARAFVLVYDKFS